MVPPSVVAAVYDRRFSVRDAKNRRSYSSCCALSRLRFADRRYSGEFVLQLQPQTHLDRAAVGSREDLAEIRRSPCGARLPEVRVIRHVKHLHAKLQASIFLEPEVLHHGDIEIVCT